MSERCFGNKGIKMTDKTNIFNESSTMVQNMTVRDGFRRGKMAMTNPPVDLISELKKRGVI